MPVQSQPSKKTPLAALANIEVRQHMLEDDTFIDIPAAILRAPPPKPTEFLYLQHYFETPSGIRMDLKQCGTPDAAVDLLANELVAMRRLLHGYVHNLSRYVEKFDGEHAKVRAELQSLENSYKGLYKVAMPACKASAEFQEKFSALEKKIESLPNITRRPPVIIKQQGPMRLKNPPMEKEEEALQEERQEDYITSSAINSWVSEGEDNLKQGQILADLLNPPPLPPQSAETKAADKGKRRADKGKKPVEAMDKAKTSGPVDPTLLLKIEKLAGGLDAIRAALHRTHTKTEQDLKHLRTVAAIQTHNVEETWQFHDHIEALAFNMGKGSERHISRVEAYDRWATKCHEDVAASLTTAVPEAQSSPTEVPPSTTDAPPPVIGTPTPAPPQHATTPLTSTVITPSSAPHTAPSLANDVYAVCLDLKCDKPIDALSHQEALDMLRTLPLRIHFMPYNPADPEPEVLESTQSEGDAAEVEEILSSVRRLDAASAPAVIEATQSPTTESASAARGVAKSAPQSRKRVRQSEQEPVNGVHTVTQTHDTAGPPMKKRVRRD